MQNYMSPTRAFAASALWLSLFAGVVPAQAPTAGLTTVEVFPQDVNLFTSRGRQTFVVKATYADGITRDVTDEAKATPGNPALVRLEKNVLFPVADGATELKVDF